MIDQTLDELRPQLIAAMLPHVAFDGWSEAALLAGARAAGIDEDVAKVAFPDGATAMVEAYIARADARLVESLAAQDILSMKVRERIRRAVATRLEQASGEREAVRRALAVLAMPQNLPLAARTLWRTADTMWRAAGDTATDYNHYTKRAILGAVYSATLLVWLDDTSEGHAETLAFLDRRIDGIMRFEKTKAKLTGIHLPSPARFLGRLRYPAI
ncbi:COQ9 family protein [Glacieibacterium sp.]|uniref:COQ9 family protein n=1 Tax=Glacieibacterium sp. TaxID=2860237 RepID=UPI003B00EE82